jgi:hypothetical protein
MQAIFDAVYFLAFLSYILLSLFIIYHIARYSVSKTVIVFSLSFFLIGTAMLLFANGMLFFSIPFDQLTTFTLPSKTTTIAFPKLSF